MDDIHGEGVIHISKQYSVWCADCDNMIDYQEFHNQREAERDFRAAGWSKTKRGWICDRCVDKRKH